MDTEEIKELVKSRAWSEDNARVSVRAEHKCEYCGLDFLPQLATTAYGRRITSFPSSIAVLTRCQTMRPPAFLAMLCLRLSGIQKITLVQTQVANNSLR